MEEIQKELRVRTRIMGMYVTWHSMHATTLGIAFACMVDEILTTKHRQLLPVSLTRYNKRRDDFETKEGWDDYLESVEDISEAGCIAWYRFAGPGIDIEATEAKVAEYKRTNHLSIIANQARQAEGQKQAQQATAAAAMAGPVPEVQLGSTAPAFTSVKPQTLIAAQPQPMKMPALNADGGLIVPRISKDAFMAMATASGWSTGVKIVPACMEIV
eukprot:365920-Chlamydomonas_euryale.AAC.10